jgi:formylmethanofuran dehydrogenase subunit E
LRGVCIDVCDNCISEYVLCHECGRYERKDRLTSIGDRNVCRSCIRDNYTTCERCGQVIRRTESYHAGTFYCRRTFCRDCYVSRRSESYDF